ncbi:transferase hexapeptide (six repeat-containing protein) [Desulfocicer vacuolatum DSM 3385]|uniref:Transferase hexapeptide (Six repeat-containing protein) n=1 Tax=Desulfocicer vacuolatum DSM 3385 TaxID=1121400 RepID=A0A1W2E927_9BACT|nr:hypothetical protein [Desulfocicer vacuolatum]SMD06293.1 transferase hexapeptide (six repeat-containing protein) [Desulfocicer vacuolatum DSM 3385]
MTYISQDFKHGSGLQIGEQTIIEPEVVVGNNVKIGHRVTLKSGTIIKDNSIIDDHCITTGACIIGSHVNIRTGAIISKSTIIEDYSFVGPGVITNHTKHVSHGRHDNIEDIQLLTYIGYGSVLGSQASIVAGIKIVPQVILGAGTIVVKDLLEPGIYIGFPAKKTVDLPQEYRMDEPENSGFIYLQKKVLNHLKTYIPHLKVEDKYKIL